jgi:hypothetical protein
LQKKGGECRFRSRDDEDFNKNNLTAPADNSAVGITAGSQ